MRKGLLLAFAALAAWAGFAQEAGLESSALFVSKLKAKVEQSRIVLTWVNPRNLQQPLLLYRHSAEITAGNLPEATLLARLSPEQESYADIPPDYRPHYYAVLIEDGRARRLLIPFRNKTSQGVRVETLPSVDSLAAHITGIRASVVDEGVRVTFSTSNPDRELLMFRSSSPMLTTEDLLDAFAPLPLDKGTKQVTDLPIPGVQTYYAVIDTEIFKLGRQELVAGENTTTQAVVVPVGVRRTALPPPAEAQAAEAAPVQPSQERPPAARAAAPPSGQPPPAPAAAPGRAAAARPQVQPAAEDRGAVRLPYLQPTQDGRIAASVPARPEPLDARTREAVSRILASAPPLEAAEKSVVILPEDKNGQAEGESAALQEILQEHLLAGQYREAESKLQSFLNLRRSAYTEARVRFYLAQAYYFQGLYEEALLEFVLAQDQLYAPAQPWLKSCFRHLWNRQ